MSFNGSVEFHTFGVWTITFKRTVVESSISGVYCCWSSCPQGAAPPTVALAPDYVTRSHYTALSWGRSEARGGKIKFSSARYPLSRASVYDKFVLENCAFSELIVVSKSGVRGLMRVASALRSAWVRQYCVKVDRNKVAESERII